MVDYQSNDKLVIVTAITTRKGSKIDSLFQQLEHFGQIKDMWLDYFCIPQDISHDKGERQLRTINSIAYFVNCCSTFVTLVGEVGESILTIYSRRGWCRFERFAAVMSKMGAVMYLHNKDTQELRLIDFLKNMEVSPLFIMFTLSFKTICLYISCHLSKIYHREHNIK